MDKILENLNPEQLAAVTLPSQSALILAGAGSGKTRVLTTRMAWLMKTGQVSPSGIMATTFTNKAAKEMLARLSVLFPDAVRNLWVGTFHGLCNRFLRKHHRDAGLPPGFVILDTQDQLAMVKRLLKAQNINDDRYPPRSLLSYINSYKEKGLRASSVHPQDDYEERMVALYALYEQECQREGVVDFAELLLRCTELFERNQLLREHYQDRFHHILVDEFQDTNDLQYRLLKQLSGNSTSVFAVGDDDQSIYAFRGANVGNMLSFQKDFHVTNLIRLEQNYRSYGNILDAANALIDHNSRRLGKNLFTDAGQGEPIRVCESTSDYGEVQWLLDEISHLVREGSKRSEIAVLYRSNAQSRIIEHGLFSAGIPYHVYGGMRFFDRAEIKHAMAYLQLVENPNNNGAFLRVVNFPARGIGARTLEQLQDVARENDISLFEAISKVTGRGGSALATFANLIQGIAAEVRMMNLPDLIKVTLEKSGLIQQYAKEKDGQDRKENLEQLASAASQFLAEEGFSRDARALFAEAADAPEAGAVPALADGTTDTIVDVDLPLNMVMSPLAAFLTHASLEAGENQAEAGQDAVQLMTVHAAKGLEFDAVFITGLEEGLFPHENSSHERSALEEERRLMYVAITRARKRLYLSFAQTRMLHGHMMYSGQSRFLSELPEENLKWVNVDRSSSYQKAHYDSYAPAAPKSPSLATAPASFHRDSEWKIGQSVRHAKFGEGVIVSLEGGGKQQRALINFGRNDMKLLDLTIAKLERV